jgi:hypothetical protein
MSPPFVAPALQRTLAAVYRFYDAFFFPIADSTPPVSSALEVSIPLLQWSAQRIETDATYRFSAFTLKRPAPTGVNLQVQVRDADGHYVSFAPILLTLPMPLSVPPKRSDFLIPTPLWPTMTVRPPDGETAVRGVITSPTAQPVAGLTIEMWTGGPPTPPPGTPLTRSNTRGEFLFRFPRLKGIPGTPLPVQIRLNGGALAVTPAALPVVFGRTQIVPFARP